MSEGIFDSSSAYYDLLYETKEYDKEAVYIGELIREFHPHAKTIADLGCGTGMHAWRFAQQGYEVEGIDQSEPMLKVARQRAPAYPGVDHEPRFAQGVLEQFRLAERKDVVVSLFDVVSYLRDYDAFRAFAENVRSALKPGGLLIFDCWYGPAVHAQRPGVRVKRLENADIKLTRIADGDFHPDHNQIDVGYEVFVTRKADGVISSFREMHRLRCYFEDELDLLLAQSGLERLFTRQWLTGKAPSTSSWSVLFGYRLKTTG
jgi:SAM-dependent methyltransferase